MYLAVSCWENELFSSYPEVSKGSALFGRKNKDCSLISACLACFSCRIWIESEKNCQLCLRNMQLVISYPFSKSFTNQKNAIWQYFPSKSMKPIPVLRLQLCQFAIMLTPKSQLCCMCPNVYWESTVIKPSSRYIKKYLTTRGSYFPT